MNYAGRVVIVTGGGNGLGRAYARAFAAEGAQTIVNNRVRPEAGFDSAADVVAEITAAGGVAVADHTSAEDPDAGARIVATALEAFGRLDIVIANAGVSAPRAFHNELLADVQQMIAINLLGAVDLVHAALPHLRAQVYGRIAVTTSSAAVYGDAGFVTYAAAKAGLIGLVKALAQESVAAGVTVNAILPFARTPMTAGLFDDGPFGGAGDALDVGSVTDLLLWLMHETCSETGRVWVAGGRVFQIVEAVISRGIELDPAERTPERLAAAADDITRLEGARSFTSGAELLESIAERSALKWSNQSPPSVP